MKQKVLKIVSIVLCLCFVFGTVSVCAETTKPIQITTDNFVEKKSEDTGKGELRSKYELGTKVEEIMIRDVVTISPEDTIETAIKVMKDSNPGSGILNQLPVIDNGKLVGIISDGDIIQEIF